MYVCICIYSKDTVQGPQAPSPLVEDPSLKDKDRLQGREGNFQKIYIL